MESGEVKYKEKINQMEQDYKNMHEELTSEIKLLCKYYHNTNTYTISTKVISYVPLDSYLIFFKFSGEIKLFGRISYTKGWTYGQIQ